jgi:hypothetical protein
LCQFASLTPGEYFVFDPRTHQIVAAIHHWESARSHARESL